MRKLYVSVLAIMACLASFAKTTTATNSGFWNDASAWDNGVPADNDIVIIPATIANTSTSLTITLNSSPTLSGVQLRIYGTLALSVNSKLELTTGSGVAVYTGGIIQGTAPSQRLIVNTTTVYTGSNPAINGPINFGTVVLPVKFAGFSVARLGGDVLVQWSTAEEANALAFEVERSTDGNTWSRIASVPARGNSSSLTTYTYSDKNVTAALAYYRIRQVDIDGKSTYTSIQSVKSAATAGDVKVAAISNRLVLQFPVQVKGAVEARVMTLSGQVVSNQVLQQPVGQVLLNTPSVKGAYIISVSNGQEINVAKQVVL